MKNKEVYFHKFEDVDYFFKKIYSESEKYLFYVTHAGVKEYIRKNYNYNSTIITELFSQKEVMEIFDFAVDISISTIKTLDEKYAHLISEKLRIVKLDYFVALYSYLLPYLLSGFYLFKNAIEKTVNSKIIFDYLEPFWKSFSLKKFIEQEKKHNTKQIKWIKKKSNTGNKQHDLDLFLSGDDIGIIEFTQKNKRFLYSEPLCDLKFLKNKNEFSCLRINVFEKFLKKYTPPHLKNIFKIDNNYIAQCLINDFLKNLMYYYTIIMNIEEILKKYNITGAIWGNSPISGWRTLFYEYCIKKNIDVVGAQHGGNYIIQKIYLHKYSDFIRCNHYISYGFSQNEFKKSFLECNIKIIPCGTTRGPIVKKDRKNIDILFPVSNAVSVFEGGLGRVKPDTLFYDQLHILQLLDEKAKQGLNVLVKPFKETNLWQTAVYYGLKEHKNIKVEWHKNLWQVMNENKVKLVIVEFFSSPLFESLFYDAEIILILREVDALTEEATALLSKRVHIVENFEGMKTIFGKWEKGFLEIKRDNTFLEKYIYKKNSKEKIINFLKDL